VLVLLVASVLAACGGDDKTASSSTSAGGGATKEADTIRLAHFANLTHAPALIGLEEGLFAKAVGSGVTIKPQVFNAGPDVVTGMLSGDIDIAFIGPNPAINAYAQSEGKDIRIIAGSTSGGAALVVADGISSLDDLAGKTIATPQLGNTQDVALRNWLTEKGKEVSDTGEGFLKIAPQANSDSLTAFVNKQIDGGWVPEPFATRYVQEGGGHVLQDEADLWDGGRFVTTHVIVRTEFLEKNPKLVKKFLGGLVDAVAFANDKPVEAKAAVNAFLLRETQKALSPAVIDAAWEKLELTVDPIASSLAESKAHAVKVGLLDEVDLKDIYDLKLLNEVLVDRGEDEVKGL
jgi:NitT/TauT family transport system substrate-binding protein